MTVKELREKRKALATTIRQLADKVNNEKRDFTAEEKTNWEQVNKDYNDLSRQIEIAERAAAVEAEQTQRTNPAVVLPGRDDRSGKDDTDDEGEKRTAGPSEEDKTLALAAWCRTQMEMDIDERMEEACKRTRLNPRRSKLNIDLADTRSFRSLQNVFRSTHPTQIEARLNEKRSLSAANLGSGQALIPEGFVNALEIAQLYFGGIAQVAEVIRTTGGEDLPWPTANDTGNKGRRLGENTAVSTDGSKTADPKFGQTIWHAYKYTSDAVLVPTELLEESVFDLPGVLGAMLGERLGRITNDENTTGTGNAMPKGIVTAATLGVTAASATKIAADELFKLVHSVDPAYRNAGCGFMLHDSIILALRLLKDGDGQYLWKSGLDQGAPDRLLGYPITMNQSMASTIATTNKTVLFGQLSKYKVRQVRGIRLYRLQERYRDSDQDGFVAFLRQDGNLLDAGVAPVKYLQQA